MGASVSFDLFDANRLIGYVEAQLPLKVDEVAGELAELGAELAAKMREMILDAHTPTGLARVAQWPGLQAGRYDTGFMYDMVDYQVLDPVAIPDGYRVTLEWGWIDEFADYFLLQEYGTDQIEEVGSLADTFTYGVTRLAHILRGAR